MTSLLPAADAIASIVRRHWGGLRKRVVPAFSALTAPSAQISTDNFGEFAEPDEDIAGQANVTITAGFKAGVTIELGKPPVIVGGSYDQTYTGSLVTSGEWWHPIVRSEVASGGVQYCKYTGAGFLSKKVATRVSLRQAKGASLGFWYLYDVQQTSATACPGPN